MTPMDLTQENLEKVVDEMTLGGFGLAAIKNEGGIADPDEFVWECWCEQCQVKYNKWKAKFQAEQKALRHD